MCFCFVKQKTEYEMRISDWSSDVCSSDLTYAVFMRRPVISAPRLALDWLAEIGRRRGVAFTIDLRYPEGKWVGAGEPMFYVTGPLSQLAELETLLLQKLGPSCVAAYNEIGRAHV